MKQEKNFNKIEKIILYMIQIVNLKLLSMFHIKFKVFRKVSSKPYTLRIFFLLLNLRIFGRVSFKPQILSHLTENNMIIK